MLDPREYEGVWWLPEDPDDTVPGKLSFSQSDIRLELLGAFGGSSPSLTVDDAPRILGMSKEGKAITLERNLGLGRQHHFPGISTTTYGPHLVLVGALYEPGEDVRFDEVSIRLSELDTWAASSGFGYQMHWDDEGKSVTRLDVSYTPPEPINVALDDKTELSIAWRWTWSGMSQVTTETRLGQAASFRVAFAEQGDLGRCLEYVFQLRNFLSLAVGRPIQVQSVGGFHNPPEDESEGHRLDVELLYRVIGIQDEPGRGLLLDEMLFTLGDALPRLEEIFRTWFARQEVFGPVFNRYFYIVHNRHMAREIQFESYIRALETYHRRSTNATELPPDEHEVRVREILSSVPDEHREWLDDELMYSNEPPLAQRLKETLARCPTITARLIGSSRNRQTGFVRKVVTTRNHEIHLDPSNERGAATGVNLVVLVFQLRALVEMTLLLDLGFRCGEVDGIFDRIRRYEQIDAVRSSG